MPRAVKKGTQHQIKLQVVAFNSDFIFTIFMTLSDKFDSTFLENSIKIHLISGIE